MVNFIRKVANSNILAGVIDIPENLRNQEVEILIFPLENKNRDNGRGLKPKKSARGLLEKYKNIYLQELERSAWAKAVAEQYENN